MSTYLRVHRSPGVPDDVDGVEDDDVAAGQDLQHVEGVDEEQRLEHRCAAHGREEADGLFSARLLFLPG